MPGNIERRTGPPPRYFAHRILDSDRLNNLDRAATRKHAEILLSCIWSMAVNYTPDREKVEKVELGLREDFFVPRNEVREALLPYIKNVKSFESVVSQLIRMGILERLKIKVLAPGKRRNRKKRDKTFYRIISPEADVGGLSRSFEWTDSFEDLASRCSTALAKEALQRLHVEDPDGAILKEMDWFNQRNGLPSWKDFIESLDPEDRPEAIRRLRIDEERFAFMVLWTWIVEMKHYSPPKWPTFELTYGSRFNVFDYSGSDYPREWNEILDHIEKRTREILGAE